MPQFGTLSYQKQIYQVFFGAIVILLALLGIRSMMAGNNQQIMMIGMLILGVGTVLALDRYYWALYPLIGTLQVKIPGLPFNTSEIAVLGIIAVYFIRSALHREQTYKLCWPNIFLYPFIAWVCVIFYLNPAGLEIAGSSAIGSRFYFQLALGFIAIHILSCLRFSEKDAKILFYLLLAQVAVSLAFNIVGFIEESAEATEERKSAYQFLSFQTVYLLMICRYSLSQIITSPWRSILLVICAGAVIFSGKRKGFANLALYPILRTLMYGKEKLILFVLGIIASFFLVCGIIGDGVLWEIPRSAKRALAIVVPSYANSDLDGGTRDLFREQVHGQAKEIFLKNPLVGRKGFAIDREQAAWLVVTNANQNSEQLTHVVTGNWHGFFWSLLCDFGLPGFILWFIFAGGCYTYIFRLLRKIRDNWAYTPFFNSCIYYYSIGLFVLFIFHFNSGHGAQTPYATCISMGWLFAFGNSLKEAYHEKGIAIKL